GALGGFELRFDALQVVGPAGRGAFGWSEPRDGARSSCDILIDLSGGTPPVAAPEKREGYLRADPGDPVAVARMAARALGLVGTFEKPLYVRLNESICAHSRAGHVG
ncbi:(4Fe-4S)-binding protein, partial [Cribrihabitans sp. XS_ASV171]